MKECTEFSLLEQNQQWKKSWKPVETEWSKVIIQFQRVWKHKKMYQFNKICFDYIQSTKLPYLTNWLFCLENATINKPMRKIQYSITAKILAS